MKTIVGLGLSFTLTAAFMGCTSTEGNTSLRNANANTGYVVSNSNAATPMPAYTPAPATNSTMNSNMKPAANSNMKPMMNSNTKPMANSAMKSNVGNSMRSNKEGR